MLKIFSQLFSNASQILAQCKVEIETRKIARLKNLEQNIDLEIGLAHTLIPALRAHWQINPGT